jgi:hypothetical protein
LADQTALHATEVFADKHRSWAQLPACPVLEISELSLCQSHARSPSSTRGLSGLDTKVEVLEGSRHSGVRRPLWRRRVEV